MPKQSKLCLVCFILPVLGSTRALRSLIVLACRPRASHIIARTPCISPPQMNCNVDEWSLEFFAGPLSLRSRSNPALSLSLRVFSTVYTGLPLSLGNSLSLHFSCFLRASVLFLAFCLCMPVVVACSFFSSFAGLRFWPVYLNYLLRSRFSSLSSVFRLFIAQWLSECREQAKSS